MPGSSAKSVNVTQLLKAWSAGNEEALERLMPAIHQKLRAIARNYMRRERPGHSMQATELVNEAYLRLVDIEHMNWNDRAHFFAVSARIMRQILVNAAHARGTQKRGGAAVRLDLDVPIASPERANELVALDDALNELAKFDARKAEVIELRFFGGLSVDETAAVLKISPQSVLRDWKLAKAWMLRQLTL